MYLIERLDKVRIMMENLSPPIWVDKPKTLNQLIETLLGEPVIAVDTESDSLYSYFEKVCLLQFSTPHADYLVDPLNVDISSLGLIFANSNIQKIFHAVEYDILSLKRGYKFKFNNLFDTMAAARVLQWPKHGLGSILQEHFGVKLDKRFQRYNWGKRPLSNKAFNYARLDTHYLLPLRQIQLTKLKDRNLLNQAFQQFQQSTNIEPTPKIFKPTDFKRIKGVRTLSKQEQMIVRELFILRDKIARRINRPPFKVMNNDVLLRLAQQKPHTYQELAQIKGLDKKVLHHNVSQLLQAIEDGLQQTFQVEKKTSRRNNYPHQVKYPNS